MKEDKELEEAIKELKSLSPSETAIKTVLQALETKDKTIADDAEDEITRFKKVILRDYIPKKKIEDLIQKLKPNSLYTGEYIQELLEDK